MRRGDFEAAWRINDAVLAARDPDTRDDPAIPYHLRWVWDGRPFDHRHVLVRCYHGLGDTLQFWRYLPALAARAASVTVELQPTLIPLLATPSLTLHPFDPANPLPPAECDIEIMELSHAFRALLPLPPGEGRGEGRDRRTFGLCWTAGTWDPARSIPMESLLPLSRHANLISLQRGPAATPHLPDPTNNSTDAKTTAQLIKTLDAVITVDTMVAHLALMLGRPTAVLLHHRADWRWGEGQHSPWYPAARLYRQHRPGDWSAPLAQLFHDVVTHPSFFGNPNASAGFVGA